MNEQAEVSADEMHWVYVPFKKEWVKWPPVVVLLGKHQESVDNVRRLSGQLTISWDLLKWMSSKKPVLNWQGSFPSM